MSPQTHPLLGLGQAMLNRWTSKALRMASRGLKAARWANSADRRQRVAFDDLRDRFYADFWQQAACNLGAEIQPTGYGFHMITRQGARTFVRDAQVMLDPFLSLEIAGNKPLSHKLLESEQGYRAPAYVEYDLDSLPVAEQFLRDQGVPCVAKPAGGTGAGRGITTHIDSRGRLLRASAVAAAFCPQLLLEQYVPGHSYRLLYLDGEIIHAVRRDPPILTGDGRSSIAALAGIENASRISSWPARSLGPLTLDLEARLTLQSQGYEPSQVLAVGESVTVKAVVNQNASPQNHTVDAGTIHPSIVHLGERIARCLDLRLMGLDIISPDISVSLDQSGGVINEVNTNPGLHHHVLLARPAERCAVGERILDRILSQRREKPPVVFTRSRVWS